MIVLRYLTREVLVSMLAVSLTLLLITISGRFVKYLAEAAAGKLDAAVLLTLMAYRLPTYLELILPLGLFIAILLAYGRMHMDSEMTVLSSCGMSEKRLVSYTLFIAFIVALVVGGLSLYVGPKGVRASEALLNEQRNRTDFESLKPERFHVLERGRGVSYASGLSADKKELQNIFMAEMAAQSADEELSLLVAKSGKTVIDPTTGYRYLVLKEGYRYEGRPGSAKYQVVKFESFAQLVPAPDFGAGKSKATDAIETGTLWQMDTRAAMAALQWRFSLPVLVLVVALLAVPFSKTQARRGRYVKMIPGILIYIVYLVVLNAVRGGMEKGNLPLMWSLWFVHGSVLALALLLLYGRRLVVGLAR